VILVVIESRNCNIDRQLSEIEARVLRAMWTVQSECGRQKSVVTLRYALLTLNKWDLEMEYALCNDGVEHQVVAEHYLALCKLVTNSPFARGRGNFAGPAGPRYTDCWITDEGKRMLSQGHENEL
jgi:hypothetical protein